MKALELIRSRTFPVLAGLAAAAIAGAGSAAVVASAPAPGPGDELARGEGHSFSGRDLSVAFERVAESIHPSVVSIRSVSRVELGRTHPALPFHGFPFGDLFGSGQGPFGQLRPDSRPRDLLQQGIGTGFVIREDGYVVTNNHVVEDADEVTVTLWDDSTHVASVVGTDPKTDLAVLRIDADGLVPAPLGDDSRLRVGSWVAAVGNPFGLSSTMTAGIVSAVGRSRVGVADYEDFIQTDAAINPGNSGGPLLNLDGEVVGINTAIASRSGGYMGIGFAIPIDMAKAIVDSLVEHGHVVRGFLGVVIQNLDEDLAASFGHDGTRGALVSDVSADGPAAAAGIRPGDILVSLDGSDVPDIDTLRMRVANTRPGTEVDVTLFRDGEPRTVQVEIGELEPAPLATAEKRGVQSIGMHLETLTPRLARRLELSPAQRGVLVARVEPFGAAARAGIRLNDVVLSVGDEAVESVADFERAIARHDLAAGVRLSVMTGTSKRFVFLRLEE